MSKVSGGCLCGAVKFTAESTETEHHACHCGMCRKWTGGPMMGIAAQGVEFSGEENLKRFDSSDHAQRGFCKECGSSLFYFLKPMQMYIMTSGVFDDQTPFKLTGEIYVDYQPPGYEFKGDLTRETEKEFLAKFGVAPE